MITEKELLKKIKKYFLIQQGWKDISKKEDAIWAEEHKIEKLLKRELAKRAKIPRSVSMKVGDYRISQTIRWGWLKIKKIKK